MLIFFADKYGETLCESLKEQGPVSAKQGTCSLCESLSFELNVSAPDLLYNTVSSQEVSGVVYTTVDFRAQQEPTELYANLRMQKTRAGALMEREEHAGMVEYSTLAMH